MVRIKKLKSDRYSVNGKLLIKDQNNNYISELPLDVDESKPFNAYIKSVKAANDNYYNQHYVQQQRKYHHAVPQRTA